MSCCRISKQELASPVGIVMVGFWLPPPVIVRNFFRRDRAVARGHREFTYLTFCRINKQEIASPGGIVMMGLWVPPPEIVLTSFGRVEA
ncbi:hypothetical protein AVEN_58440-1 [Araneus ventricosus]|uniref:Uncharacterized protein n=1 Tax=Araneus ventricosus TaxID=182803 RepID=A0A4Y2IPS6_ARAVE|nr:hypothetical protein AVEN_58440-1 [Araneus ventricosus]